MLSFILYKNRLAQLFLGGFLVCWVPVQAEPLSQPAPLSLTLPDAMKLATQHNLQFKTIQAQLGISDAEIRTASTLMNPSLMSDNGVAEFTYRLGIQQTFELGGQRYKRMAIARAHKRVVEESIRQGLLELYSEVRAAYVGLYYAQARCKTYERLRDQEEKLVSIAKSRVDPNGGSASEEDVDVMQTEIQLLSTENDLDLEERQMTEAQHHLNAVLNMPLQTPLHLAAPPVFPELPVGQTPTPIPSRQVIESLDQQALIQQALERRPDLKQLQAEAAVLPQQLRLSKADRIPKLTLAVGPDTVTEPKVVYSVFAMGFLELPIFDRQQGPIQRILAEQVQKNREEAALKLQIQLEVSNAYNALLANEERVLRFEEKLLPLGFHLSEKSRENFEQRKTSVLVPLTAQHQYTQTVLGHLQALKDLQDAMNDLEKAIGAGL